MPHGTKDHPWLNPGARSRVTRAGLRRGTGAGEGKGMVAAWSDRIEMFFFFCADGVNIYNIILIIIITIIIIIRVDGYCKSLIALMILNRIAHGFTCDGNIRKPKALKFTIGRSKMIKIKLIQPAQLILGKISPGDFFDCRRPWILDFH